MTSISVDTSGYSSLFAASVKLAQQTVAANVPSQAERNLKKSNRSLSREITNLNTENKLLTEENQILTRSNRQLSQQISRTQAQKTQNLYAENNLNPDNNSPAIDASSDTSPRESVSPVAATIIPAAQTLYDSNTNLSNANNPGSTFAAMT